MFALQDTLRTYLLAGFVSFVFFALQAILLLALDITTSYFQAQLIIAVGLFGLLLGTMVAVYVQDHDCAFLVGYSLSLVWLLPLLSLGLVLISFSYPLLATGGFVLVFAPLGFIVSVLYRFVSPWKLYTSELLGAVLGLGYFILVIPYMRSENAFILLVGLAALGSLALLWRHMITATRMLLIAVLVASGTGLYSNIVNHHINFALHTVCDGEQASAYNENKIACLDELGVPYELGVSLGSLQNRIDVYRTATDGFFFTAYSGTRNDVMQPFSAEYYTRDARVPAGLIAEPKTLIIGAGAEGVAKVVKSIGSTDITVVESNPAVLDIWNESLPYATYAHYPLKDTRVVLDDGRLFAAKAQSEYDIITMMNTRRSLHVAQFGFPNFLHTKEAYGTYYDALTSGGFLAIEEVSYENGGDEAIVRSVATIVEMLGQKGVEDPYQHIIMYQWVGAEKDQPIPKDSPLMYSQILVKKAPWSTQDLTTFRAWSSRSQQTGEFMKPANMTYYRSIWLPDTGINPDLDTSLVLVQPFTEQVAQLKVLTDNSPFITTMSPVDTTLLYWFFSASAVLFGVFLLWYRRYSVAYGKSWLGYFSLIGIGYMAIEMFLLLWLQLYLGSIFVTLVVVIGGLFVSSAVASWCYQQRSFSVKSLVVRGLFTIIVLGVVFYFPWAIGTFLIRVLVSVIAVAAIGVLLAPFFPFAMQLAENQTTQHAPIWFGVNAIALAVTVPISILVVSYTSFEMLLVISVVAYAAALVLLSRIRISA
jgi:hypothetical protein